MPLPRFVARFNKVATNRILIRLADRPPFAAITHTGRRSGRSYRIPINAFPSDGGFVFALTYGPESDWVKNVLATGTAVLDFDGRSFQLDSPRLVDRSECDPALPVVARALLSALGVRQCLYMARKP